MLKLVTSRRTPACDGGSRRDFLKIGALGATGVLLPDLLRARAANTGGTRNTSVVWLWLGGGPTHVETFDPKMSAPSEYRSVTGSVNTNVPGIDLGGNFTRMAKVADKMAFVRSFAHRNSGHGGGTHWVMTGYDFAAADNGAPANKPGIGAIVSRYREQPFDRPADLRPLRRNPRRWAHVARCSVRPVRRARPAPGRT